MHKFIAAIYPMKHIENAFTDIVSGKKVSYYRQVDGKVVMAETRFSLFRVASNQTCQ